MRPVAVWPAGIVVALLLQWPGGILHAAEMLSRTNLLQWQDSEGAIHEVTNLESWAKRRASILKAMEEVMGPLPGEEKRCPLEVKVEEEVDCGTYVRRFLSYASEPNCRTPAYLLIPKKALETREEFPAVLCLHQTHAAGQKVVVGLGISTNDEYAVELVKRGYVCIAPPYPHLANYAPDLKALGYASGTMKAIWDNIRAMDLLEGLPFVRKGKFGSIGHSLGGHNGIYTAVYDSRIAVVASNCGLDLFRDYMNGNIRGWTSERYMPQLLNYSLEKIPFDFAEIVGAIAPRQVLIIAPKGDTNFKWESVDRLAAAARLVFKIFGAEGNLEVLHPDAGHVFLPEMRQEAYKFIDSVLKAEH